MNNHNLRCLLIARPRLTLVSDLSSPLLQGQFMQRLWCLSMVFGTLWDKLDLDDEPDLDGVEISEVHRPAIT